MRTLNVTTGAGIPFDLFWIPAGEADLMTGAPVSDDLVKIYDRRHMHTPRGQYVSSYYRATLLGTDEFNRASSTGNADPITTRGLNMHGGVPDWQLDRLTYSRVLSWLLDESPEGNSTYDGSSYVNPYDSMSESADGYTDGMHHRAHADMELLTLDGSETPDYIAGYRRAFRDVAVFERAAEVQS